MGVTIESKGLCEKCRKDMICCDGDPEFAINGNDVVRCCGFEEICKDCGEKPCECHPDDTGTCRSCAECGRGWLECDCAKGGEG